MALLFLGMFSGCEGPPQSISPVYTIAESSAHPTNDLLLGRWTMASLDSVRDQTSEAPKSQDDLPDFWIEVTPDEDRRNGSYVMEFRPQKPNDEFDYVRFNFALVPIKGKTFFDVVFQGSLEYSRKWKTASDMFGVNTHLFGPARLERD